MKPAQTFSYQLHALVYSLDELADGVLRRHAQLRLPQFMTILCVYQNPACSQRFAADWLRLTEASVSHMVTKSIRDGFITAEQSLVDSRSKQLTVTAKGKAIIEDIYPLLEQSLAPHLADLTPEELHTTQNVIRKIEASLLKTEEKCHE